MVQVSIYISSELSGSRDIVTQLLSNEEVRAVFTPEHLPGRLGLNVSFEESAFYNRILTFAGLVRSVVRGGSEIASILSLRAVSLNIVELVGDKQQAGGSRLSEKRKMEDCSLSEVDGALCIVAFSIPE